MSSNHKPHMTVRLAGVGVALKSPISFIEAQLPLSSEGVVIYMNPPFRGYYGLTAGGVIGYSTLVSDPFSIPEEYLKEMGAGLSNWSIRVKVGGLVLFKSRADIEVTFYKPDGTPLGPFVRHINCAGTVLGSVNIDATLHALPTDKESEFIKYEKKRFEKIGAVAAA